MLSSRSFVVKFGSIVSRNCTMAAGVPQGSVLGPLMFNLYLHDLPNCPHLRTLQFADDTSFFISHKNPDFAQHWLNLFLIRLHSYFIQWKLILNTSKSNFLNVTGFIRETGGPLRYKSRKMVISINGEVVNHVNHLRLLGLTFSNNNRFNAHIRVQLKKAKFVRHKLNKIFTSRLIGTHIKSNIYKMYVRPIITYAGPIWCRKLNTSSRQMEIIRTFERGVLRSATNLHRRRGEFKYINSSAVYRKARTDRIDKYIANRHIRFFNKIHLSDSDKLKKTLIRCNDCIEVFPKIDYMYLLHNDRQLFVNEKFLHFNARYNGNEGVLYPITQ